MKSLIPVGYLGPVILLAGLYLVSGDASPQDIQEKRVGVAEAPVEISPATTASTPAPEIQKPTAQTYWEFKDLWDSQEVLLTEVGFRRWEETQMGNPLRIPGEVLDVEFKGIKEERCKVSIRELDAFEHALKLDYFSWVFLCDEVDYLTKGDLVDLHCQVGSLGGLIAPFIEGCMVVYNE